MAATFSAWALDRLVFAKTLRRIQAKMAQLSVEMGLRSAEVIPFPVSRRRRSSNLLNLTQRAEARAQSPKPRLKPATRHRTWR